MMLTLCLKSANLSLCCSYKKKNMYDFLKRKNMLFLTCNQSYIRWKRSIKLNCSFFNIQEVCQNQNIWQLSSFCFLPQKCLNSCKNIFYRNFYKSIINIKYLLMIIRPSCRFNPLFSDWLLFGTVLKIVKMWVHFKGL